MFTLLIQLSNFRVTSRKYHLTQTACTLLNLLSSILKHRFEELSSLYIPYVLKQTYVKIKVIAKAADECIKSLLKNSEPMNIKAIIDGCRDEKNSLLRLQCCGFMKTILLCYKEDKQEKVI